MTDFSNMENKQDTPKVGVGVIVTNSSGKILMGKRKGSHGAGLWSLPGGHQDVGETFNECCIREVEEETEIDLSDVEIRKAGFFNNIMEDEGLHYITLYFSANCGEQEPELPEPDKCEGWEWFHLHELPENIFEASREVILLSEGIGREGIK